MHVLRFVPLIPQYPLGGPSASGMRRMTVVVVDSHIQRNLDRLGLLSPMHGQRSQQKRANHTPINFDDKAKFLKAKHRAEKRNKCSIEVHGGVGLEPLKLAREPVSTRPRPCAYP